MPLPHTLQDELLNVDVEETDYLFGLFEHSHMSYALLANKSKEPSLEEMSQRAVEMLRKYPNGYVLLVEGEGEFLITYREPAPKKQKRY